MAKTAGDRFRYDPQKGPAHSRERSATRASLPFCEVILKPQDPGEVMPRDLGRGLAHLVSGLGQRSCQPVDDGDRQGGQFQLELAGKRQSSKAATADQHIITRVQTH